MNVEEFLKTGPIKTIPNPKYKPNSKKNTEPPTIQVTDYTRDQNRATDFAIKGIKEGWSMTTEDSDKLRKYGITPAPFVNIQKELADAQSNWSKFGGFVAQTLSEITLGTIGAGVDIFDYVASNVFHLTEDDYQSALGNKIDKAQDYIRDTAAPIYYNPDAHLGSGAMHDFGWWCNNATSIVSSLTLLLPSTGITKGIGWLGKILKADKAFTKVAKWAAGTEKAVKAEDFGVIGQALFSVEGQAKLKGGAELLSNGWLMRTMENYQESRDTYKQVYDIAADKLYSMSNEEYQDWLSKNNDIVPENIDTNSRDEVAKSIAKQSADRTFAMDFSNIIFDVIQLHGLKNIGRAAKQISKATAKEFANQAAMEAAKTAGVELTEEGAKSIGRFAKAKAFVANGFKSTYKTILEESTEGIEEAVNYIAQQEGITYGKALLEGMKDEYKPIKTPVLKKFGLPINAISTWTNLQNPFRDYIRNGELYDSAFWGVIGGVVFGGGANAFNNARDIRRSKKAKEVLKDESIDTSWMGIFDTYETKAAKNMMQHSVAAFNQLKADMEAIDNGLNVFGEKDSQGNYLPFEDKSGAEQELARQRVWDAYVTDIGLRAINNGTFDMMKEYFQSKEVKNAMVKLGLNNETDIETHTTNTIQQLENVRKIYSQQSAFINAQIAEINALKNNGFDELISLVYAQEIAKHNTEAILIGQDIDSQIAVIDRTIARTLESTDAETKKSANIAQAETNVRLAYYLDLYSRLKADEAAVKEAENVPEYEKKARLNEIERNKERILKYIKETTFGDIAVGAPALMLAERQAQRYVKVDGRYVDVNLSDEEAQELDKNILANAGFKALNAANGNLSEDVIISQANALASQLISVVGGVTINGEKFEGLASQLPTLFKNYAKKVDLEVLKNMNEDRIASTTDRIKEQIDILSNRYNTARNGAILLAGKTIGHIYEKYNKVEDSETRENIVNAIFDAYIQDKTKARELASKYLTEAEVEEFMDALDIFSKSAPANTQIYNYFRSILAEVDIKILQGGISTETATENLANNGSTNENSTQSTNSTTQQQNAPTASGNAQNEQDNREKRTVKISYNRGKNSFSVRYTDRSVTSITTNVVPARINSNGTVELMFSEANPNTQRKAIDYLFIDDANIDLEAGVTWQIDSNPVFNVKDGKLVLRDKGHISRVEGNIDNNTPPVEDNNSSSSEGNNSSNSTNGQNNSDTNDSSTQKANNSKGIDSDTSSQGSDLSTGGVTDTQSQGQQDADSLLAKQQQLVDYVYVTTCEEIQRRGINMSNTSIDVDFDDLRNTIVKNILDANQQEGGFKVELQTSEIEKLVDNRLDTFKKARALLAAKRNSIVAKSAAAVGIAASINAEADNNVMAARRADVSNPIKLVAKSIFEQSAKDLIDTYSSVIVIPKVTVNGVEKSIIPLDQLLAVCEKAIINPTIDQLELLNKMLVEYLKTRNDVMIINEANAVNKVINNYNKRNDVVSDAIRVDLANKSTNPQVIDAIASMPNGATLDARCIIKNNGEKQYALRYNNVAIGTLYGAGYRSDGYYDKVVKGIRYTIKKDKQGKIIGTAVDIIKTIFTSNDPDCVQLRQILTDILIKVNTKQGTQKDIVKQYESVFSSIPYIKQLADYSSQELKNGNNIFYVDVSSGNVEYVNVLEHLCNLWNYCAFEKQVITDAITKDQQDNALLASIDNWFSNIYTSYDTIQNMPNSDTTVTVEKINDGSLIYNTVNNNGTEEYIYTPVSESVDFKLNPTIGVIKELRGVRSIALSNGKTEVFTNDRKSDAYNLRRPKPGFVILNLTSNNTGYNYYVYARPMSATSLTGASPIGKAVQDYVKKVVMKPNTEQGKSSIDIDELETLFRDLFESINNTNTCPLFRTDPDQGLKVDRNLNKVGISTVSNLDNTKNGFTFKVFNNGMVRNVRIISDNGVLTLIVDNDRRNAITDPDILKQQIIKILESAYKTSVINVDINGCKADSQKVTNFDYGCISKNGKFVFKLGDTEIEYKSYNDFIISNNFVSVPLKLENGRQFTPTRQGAAQKQNQVLYVNATTNKYENEQLEGNEYKETYTLDNDYQEIKTTVPNVSKSEDVQETDKHDGLAIAKIMLGNTFEQFANSLNSSDLLLEDVLPRRIGYDNRLNKKRSTGEVSGVMAYTKTKRNGSYSIFVEGNPSASARFKSTIDTVIGPKFLAYASSNRVDHRGMALRVLMHERIHTYLREHPISLELIEVYNEFKARRDEDMAKGVLNKNSYVYKAISAYEHRLNIKTLTPEQREAAVNVLMEEFMVESLTSESFYNYLNSIETDTTDNGKEDNFFTKVIKAIARFFGWGDVNDNSLLMKELNIIRNAVGSDKISFGYSVKSDTFVEENQDNSETNKEEPVGEQETESGKTSDEESDETDTTDNGSEDTFGNKDDDPLYMGNYSEEATEELNDLIDSLGSSTPDVAVDVNDVNLVPIMQQMVGNTDTFKVGLSSEESAKFDDFQDSGNIEISCKI